MRRTVSRLAQVAWHAHSMQSFSVLITTYSTHTHTSCTKLSNPPSAAPSAVNGPILSHRTQPSPPYRCVQPSSASSSSRAGLIAEQHAEDCWRSALDAACGSRAMHMHRREFKWPGLDLSGLGGPTSVPGEDKSIFCCRMNVEPAPPPVGAFVEKATRAALTA